jgi:thermitase
MSFTGKPARYIIAALLLLPAARASAVRVERLSRFSVASGQSSHMEVAAGSVLVKFKAGISTAAAAAALQPSGFSIARTFDGLGWSLVSLPGGMSVNIGLDALKSLPQVGMVEPNKIYRAKRAPNDAYASLQYALSRVQAFGAWEYETGVSSRVTIAIIDTGIDGTHPEISGKLTGTSKTFNPDNGNFLVNEAVPTPACNHATRAAGVAAAASDNSTGVAGMSWGGRLLSLKVFDDNDCTPSCGDEAGYGSCSTTNAAMAAAIVSATPLHNTAEIGKLVINLSLGCPVLDCGSCGGVLQTAVANAAAAGVLIFAAAGNDGGSLVDSPADCPGAYAVGATDIQDKLASFSNIDNLMLTKGLAAPGVDIYTTDINGGYASATGTSFASPMAAGLAALVWSAKPSLTSPADVFDIIKNSADDLGAAGPDRYYGYGRINAYRAICSVVSCPSYTAGPKKASAYPNPFRPASHRLLAFKTAPDFDTSGIEIKVYTSEGELVKKLTGLAWDGKNEAGLPVASGVYLFRVKTDSDAAVGKFALIR